MIDYLKIYEKKPVATVTLKLTEEEQRQLIAYKAHVDGLEQLDEQLLLRIQCWFTSVLVGAYSSQVMRFEHQPK